MEIYCEIKQDMINSIKMLPHNDDSIEFMKIMLIRYIKKDERYGPIKPKVTGIEKNFQEDMINDMDMGQ